MKTSPLHRHLLRTMYGLSRQQQSVTRTLLCVLAASAESDVDCALDELIVGGAIHDDEVQGALRLTMEGLALALLPAAIAFERRQGPRGGPRRALRSVA